MALPRIGSDCRTHPEWRHDDEGTWAARIPVCFWWLFLMLVKAYVCRARSAASMVVGSGDGLRSGDRRVRVAAHEVASDAADRDVAKCVAS
jgi:hypothetical protein